MQREELQTSQRADRSEFSSFFFLTIRIECTFFFSDIVQSINEIALKQSTQTLQVVRSAADRAERRQWKKNNAGARKR